MPWHERRGLPPARQLDANDVRRIGHRQVDRARAARSARPGPFHDNAAVHVQKNPRRGASYGPDVAGDTYHRLVACRRGHRRREPKRSAPLRRIPCERAAGPRAPIRPPTCQRARARDRRLDLAAGRRRPRGASGAELFRNRSLERMSTEPVPDEAPPRLSCQTGRATIPASSRAWPHVYAAGVTGSRTSRSPSLNVSVFESSRLFRSHRLSSHSFCQVTVTVRTSPSRRRVSPFTCQPVPIGSTGGVLEAPTEQSCTVM